MKQSLYYLTILFLISSFSITVAERKVSGIIDKDTKWNAEEGPFIVTDDILVSRNARLLITPGATVIIAAHPQNRPTLPQFDSFDSSTISIRIQGALNCAGRITKRITFSPVVKEDKRASWYGIIFDKAADQFSEIAFTDIAGAYNGLTANDCSPIIRNSIFEFNNVGINCKKNGSSRIYNCVIAHNFTAGISVEEANPQILNSIIAFNRINGILCDGLSKIKFEYSCLSGNSDGNFLDCDPELGVLIKNKKSKIQTDLYQNIFCDPVFAGSATDSLAVERDIKLQTNRSRMKDTLLAKVIYDTLTDSLAEKKRHRAFLRYSLSRYSSCVNSGSPSNEFKDKDGSRNDMGIYGGPEFLAVKDD